MGWLALAAQLVVLLVISAHVYHRFELASDFATFHQAWYGIAHGNLNPQTTFIHLSFGRNEAAFVIWLLAPLYYLYPHAIGLLWIQDLAVVGAELVAFLWVIEALERRQSADNLQRWVAPSLALVLMLANPWIYLTIVQDFHVEPLTALFLVLAGRDLWRQRLTTAWVWAGATLLTGTIGGLSVVGLGLAAVLAGGSMIRRQGLALAVFGIAWIGLILILPADLGGGADAYAYLESPGSPTSGVGGILALLAGLFSHPGRALDMIGNRSGLLYDNLASFGYLGVLWPWAGVVIVLLTLINVLNVDAAFVTPGFQNISTYVLGAAGTAFVIGRMIAWRKGRFIALVLAAGLAVSAVTFFLHRRPHIPCGNADCSLSLPSVTPAAATELSSVLTSTPPDAEVVSSFGISGRFAGRRVIYILNSAKSGFVGAPPRPTVPVSARPVVFVFAPYQGIEPVNVIPAISYVRDQLHAQVLTERAGVHAFFWHPPPGVKTVTLPIA